MTARYDIALDISFAFSTGGIGTYSHELLKAFVNDYSDHPFLLLSNRLPKRIPQYANQEQMRATRMPELPYSWTFIETLVKHRLWWQYRTLPSLLNEFKPRVYHAVDNISLPFRRVSPAMVLTLHDIIPLTHPGYCRYRDAFAAGLLIKNAVRKADAIITDSYYSADQILQRFPKVESKLSVVYLGIDQSLFKPHPDRECLAANLKTKYKFYSDRYLLCVATLNPRRNLVRLFQAFSSLLDETNDPDLCLVVAGCRGWKDHSIFKAVRRLPYQARVHFLDYVSDSELVRLYQSAEALVNPSLLEGFGFPVLEAMACGTPVLCSRTTSLGEIAGDAAFLFDPLDLASIRQALMMLLNDRQAVNEKIQRGLLHSQRFTWPAAARHVFEIYRTLM